MRFEKWLDNFIEEKEIDLNDTFEIENNEFVNIFDYGYVVDSIKTTSTEEKYKIKDILVKIDLVNGDCKDFLRYLAKALCW